MKKWIGVLLAVCVVGGFAQVWDIDTVDTLGDVGAYSSLAIDSDKLPHIAYFYADSVFLKYAFWDGAVWNTEVVDDNSGLGGVGTFASLGLSTISERPQIAYYDALNGHLKWARLDPGDIWFIGTPDDGASSTNDVGQGCDIALSEESGQDIAHISYYDITAGYLKYVRNVGGDWVTDTVDTVGILPIFGTDIKGTSITLDAGGNPHIAYYAIDTISLSGILKYAHLVSGNWQIDTVEADSGVDLGLWPDIELVEEGGLFAYISYFDNTNLYFKYARQNPTGWSRTIIDNTPGVGMYSSQKLGSTHTGYYDSSNGNLKYAFTNDYLGWHSEEVDTLADVGQFTSIDLTTRGAINFPHISYYDVTNGDLKYATKVIKDMLPSSWRLTRASTGEDVTFVLPESTYVPYVMVKNQGNAVTNCTLKMTISYGASPVHSFTSAVVVDVDDSVEVACDSWITLPYQDVWYPVNIVTILADDSVHSNDTIIDSIYATTVGIMEEAILPTRFEMSVNGSDVKLFLPSDTEGELYLLDVTGSRRLVLSEGSLRAGTYRFTIDDELPSGVYFVRFSSPAFNLTRKTILVR